MQHPAQLSPLGLYVLKHVKQIQPRLDHHSLARRRAALQVGLSWRRP